MVPVIDCQVHAYDRDRPERPWAGSLAGPASATGDEMVAAMDAVGVDGALLVSPYRMYRYDGSYALTVQAAHPGRFGLVKPFDPNAADVAGELAAWAKKPGVVGARLMLTDGFGDGAASAEHPGFHRLLDGAARLGLPVNVLCWGALPLARTLAERHPDTRVVIDHLGLPQPFHPPPPAQPFRELPAVLALAELPNVAIKVSGAGTLSHRPFPFDDIWDPLARVFDAFGLERCLWGTDWTRAVELLTYREGVEAFRATDRLSAEDRAMLMGGALTRIYGFSPTLPTSAMSASATSPTPRRT